MADDPSTLKDLAGAGASKSNLRWRQVGALLLALMVLAAMLGWLGPSDANVFTEEPPYTLEVTYAEVTRSGLPVPVHIRVTSSAGFDGPIQLAVTDTLFDDVDFQNWWPNPSAESGEPDQVVYEFDPPRGSVFETSLDARTSPGLIGSIEDYEVVLLVDDRPWVSQEFTVRVMP